MDLSKPEAESEGRQTTCGENNDRSRLTALKAHKPTRGSASDVACFSILGYSGKISFPYAPLTLLEVKLRN